MNTAFRKIPVVAGFLFVMVSGGAFSQSTGVPDKDPDVDSEHYESEGNTHFQIFAENESDELTKALKTALEEKGPDYIPRTEHLNVNKSPHYTNRLISEDSPYLIQHAHNPVNWYPWGEEAFEKAWSEDKPVFMSIGYATCHWCHVMERESFESKEIAAFMNEHFVSIKVDREQRPDIDATYMMAVQMIAGRGGWPMSSFLTDAAKPFFGGTYYPPDAFLDLLKRVDTVWKTQKDSLLNEADELSAAVARSSDLQGEAAEIGETVIDQAVENLLGNHDDLQGGFSVAPKFPQEPSHFLLLEQARLKSDKELLSVSDFSLTMMASGGIHDQVAGGFHRYSVDNEWLVPHFEKMLYNQAALARLYFQAYTLTADDLHLRTSRRILDYIQREMTSPEGGFYSATDADSEGEEGVFFVWTPEELEQALGKDDAKLASAIWGVTEGGNFEHSNILNLENTIEEIADELDLSQSALVATMDRLAAVLLEKRQARIPPLLDDKLITEWNAMMITAFAEVAAGLDDSTYRETAITAANTIWKHNHRDDGRLWRAHFAGRSSIEANQADYAFLAEAMIALYDLTYEQHWLDKAVNLTQTMSELFLDHDGTYFMGSLVVSGAALPSRPKDLFDNATASGNSAALRTLTRLWVRTGEEKYREQATKLLAAFHTSLTSYSSGFGYLLTAASELLHGESGAIRYAGRGNVRLLGTLQSDNEILVNVDIKPGWHINSRKPIQDYLIPTRVLDDSGTELGSLKYPEPSIQTLGFERSELSLYDGSFVITADIPSRSDKDLPGLRTVVLELQACNDEVCLAPESVRLNIQVSGQTL